MPDDNIQKLNTELEYYKSRNILLQQLASAATNHLVSMQQIMDNQSIEIQELKQIINTYEDLK